MLFPFVTSSLKYLSDIEGIWLVSIFARYVDSDGDAPPIKLAKKLFKLLLKIFYSQRLKEDTCCPLEELLKKPKLQEITFCGQKFRARDLKAQKGYFDSWPGYQD